jgi:hypothetical protein
MNWLEQKYLNILTGKFRNYRRINDRTFNFSCPICGDSKKNKRKARGYITEKKGSTIYTCHNVCGSMQFSSFFKRVDPVLYDEYQKERIVAGLWMRKRTREPGTSFKTGGPQFNDKGPSASAACDSDDPLRFLKRIDTLPETHYARKFCEKRCLPDLTLLYHCPCFYTWTNTVVPGTFKDELCTPRTDHSRLIIPFYNQGGKLIAFQGRDYRERSSVKYITIKIEEDSPKIWGADRISDGTVYAFEGPLDAMFIPNGIAFAGGDYTTLKDYDPKRTVVVFDNEPRSADTKHKLLKAVSAGYGVVVWPRSSKEKDVNDMVKNGVDPDIILEIIKANTYRGLAAESEIAHWSYA